MRYRFSQIKIKPQFCGNMGEIRKAVLRELSHRRHCPISEIPEISNLEIIRESIDARKKPNVKLVYTIDFDCEENLGLEIAKKKIYDLDRIMQKSGKDLSTLNPGAGRPVIAGLGPCGMFAALTLAQAGMRPIVLERGKPVGERILDVEKFWSGEGKEPDPESNVQFGEGGAGTFSDGKLTTGIKDIRIRKVLEEFVAAGADPSILYKHRPHLGTDSLRGIVKNIRQEIIRLGGDVRFGCRMDRLITRRDDEGKQKLRGIQTASGEIIDTDWLILATGHSARDTFRLLQAQGMNLEPKPFSIGVRIQHPQEMINRSQYGDPNIAKAIGPADYKLNWKCENGRGVYTFCMCPGGYVIDASTEPETKVTNGMSNSSRDGEFANSALLVDVRVADFANPEHPEDPLAGVEFQRKYERLAWKYQARTTYGEFKQKADDSVRNSLPEFAWQAMLEAMPHLGEKLKGFDHDDSVMIGVESRSSSPVRIPRDENMQSSIRGVIPAGEGPGHAGGIMSAAVDGIRAAETIIKENCCDI